MSGSADVPEAGCLAAWCAGDDWCAVTCTMDVIGNKWHPVVVHRLLEHGPLRFSELAADIGSITNKVLSNSLKALQKKGVVERTISRDQPLEVEYALTERGQSLAPVIEALEQWGKTYATP